MRPIVPNYRGAHRPRCQCPAAATRTLRHEARLPGERRRPRPTGDAHLVQHPADVHVDRPLADEQPLGDLAVGAALADDEQDLQLPAAETEGDGRSLRGPDDVGDRTRVVVIDALDGAGSTTTGTATRVNGGRSGRRDRTGGAG